MPIESKRFRSLSGAMIEVSVKPYDRLITSLYQPSTPWEAVVIESVRNDVASTIRIDYDTFIVIIQWLKEVGDGEFWKFIEKGL